MKNTKNELTKGEFRFAIGIGFSLGMMVVVIWSFITFINQSMKQMNLGKQIKHNLIEDSIGICGEIYPVVHTAIYRDRIVTECRTE